MGAGERVARLPDAARGHAAGGGAKGLVVGGWAQTCTLRVRDPNPHLS
jgi:hypothetical protein